MLAEKDTEAILKAVSASMRSFKFKLVDDAVKIMSGTMEGIYAWLTVNYLLNHISPTATVQNTAGMIDLGGRTYAV